ncbi:MAG: type II toxin-antitoxin system RelE/ParE family toxin [Ginsengibacter sp.]
MAYQLIWSAEAETDFKNIILYLKTRWSLESSEKFIFQTYKKLQRVVAMPSIARSTSQESIYMIKLDRKNVLFFALEEKFLILLSIYPYKKDITKSKYY